jgi:hypothetical protein
MVIVTTAAAVDPELVNSNPVMYVVRLAAPASVAVATAAATLPEEDVIGVEAVG